MAIIRRLSRRLFLSLRSRARDAAWRCVSSPRYVSLAGKSSHHDFTISAAHFSEPDAPLTNQRKLLAGKQHAGNGTFANDPESNRHSSK
jgi:hypothetical protein